MAKEKQLLQFQPLQKSNPMEESKIKLLLKQSPKSIKVSITKVNFEALFRSIPNFLTPAETFSD